MRKTIVYLFFLMILCSFSYALTTSDLLPNGAGDLTQWTPLSGSNYLAVDDATDDGDTTYVYVSSTTGFMNDTYNIVNGSLTGMTINSVTIYASSKYVSSGSGSSPSAPVLYQLLRIGGVTYASSTSDTLTTSYVNTGNIWTTNPATSSAWTSSDIDSLQAGIMSKATNASKTFTPRVTRVWVIVDYTNTPPSVVLNAPENQSTTEDTTPTLSFTGTDPSNEDVRYNFQLSNNLTFGEAWDVSTGSYASKNLNVSAQETSPTGLAFSSDGTKAYIIGDITNTIYQYTLGTAWDVSTGSYASKNLSVTAQDTIPTEISFSSDGTKAYVLGFFSDTIYQYTLGTAWDISTGVYSTKESSVTTQDGNPFGLAFSSDGTKAYIVGDNSNTIYQYTLSITIINSSTSGTDAGFSGSPDNTDPFTSGQEVSYTVQSELSSGQYYWRVRGIDPTGSNTYGNWSEIRTFTLEGTDIVAPTIQFVTPTETSGESVSRTYIQINVTATDSGDGLKNITIRLYNSTNSLINITNSLTSPNFVNYTNLELGLYYFNATACDNADNCNNTETRNITLSSCSIELTLSSTLLSGINWSVNDLPSTNLNALGNNALGITEYSAFVTITGTCKADLYIKGWGNLTSGANIINLQNETYCYNSTDNTVPGTACNALSTTYQLAASNMSNSDYVYFKFYLNVPSAQQSGIYNNTIGFKAQKTEE